MAETLADAVAAATAEAGRMVHGLWRTEFRRWEKSPGHPVCDVDLAADALLRERLTAIDPAAGWLSEETVDDPARLARRRLWVVDPIDGTRDFLRGRPGWAVSVALIEDGRPVIGVLDAPARDEHWRAEYGKGATLNGEALRASAREVLVGARVPTDALPKVDSDLIAVAKPNSIALRMAMVASGEADLLASLRWGAEWDIAAATLIVAEAGGIVTDALGAPLCFNTPGADMFGVLATAAGIHHAAVARLADRARVASVR
ncbi:myo-inositol-1(or 4)-monophosphatase [Sphingomonas zeicaulis]|uniref:3'(2'),5'-bisphosphate nucleotidase CysQ n=1 Tax=Sphingomonas zeicaulis TaxID=1632740 RepID=UPI003D1D9D56